MADAEASPESEDEVLRFLDVGASDLSALGETLGKTYGERSAKGLERVKVYYVDSEPISFTTQTWQELAEHARKAVEDLCPTASLFFAGLRAGFGWDPYMLLLDFEVYTLELHRQAEQKLAVRRRRIVKLLQAVGAARCELKAAKLTGVAELISVAEGALREAEAAEQLARDRNCGSSESSSGSSDDDGSSSSSSESGSETGARGSKHDGDMQDDTELGDCSSETEDEPVAEPKCRLSGRCTGFATAGAGQPPVVAQTCELPPALYGYGDLDCVLRLSVANAPRVLAYDTDGRLCPIGINDAGLGVAVFNLHLVSTDGFSRPSLSVQSILWELLLARHTLTSALTWLRSLPPVMCGSSLLLVDQTGAVAVELSSTHTVAVSDISELVARANHPLLESTAPAYGDNAQSRKNSELRLRALTSRLAKHRDGQPDGQPAKNTSGTHDRRKKKSANRRTVEQKRHPADRKVMDADKALDILGSSMRIRNKATLACVACDPRGELRVDFRERQAATEEHMKLLKKDMGFSSKQVEALLKSGALEVETELPRLVTGVAAPHVVRWARSVFSLTPAQTSSDLPACPEQADVSLKTDAGTHPKPRLAKRHAKRTRPTK